MKHEVAQKIILPMLVFLVILMAWAVIANKVENFPHPYRHLLLPLVV